MIGIGNVWVWLRCGELAVGSQARWWGDDVGDVYQDGRDNAERVGRYLMFRNNGRSVYIPQSREKESYENETPGFFENLILGRWTPKSQAKSCHVHRVHLHHFRATHLPTAVSALADPSPALHFSLPSLSHSIVRFRAVLEVETEGSSWLTQDRRHGITVQDQVTLLGRILPKMGIGLVSVCGERDAWETVVYSGACHLGEERSSGSPVCLAIICFSGGLYPGPKN